MVEKAQPKVKKGTLVSFAGANDRKPLKKTFVHAISTDNEIDFYYLIEHPQGVVLCDATRNQFTFDLTGVKDGLRYIIAYEGEIEEVKENASISSTNTPAAPATEKGSNDPITVTMPYYQWLAIMSALQTTHAVLVNNKVMVLTQPDMTEELYQEQLKGNLDAQKSIQDADI